MRRKFYIAPEIGPKSFENFEKRVPEQKASASQDTQEEVNCCTSTPSLGEGVRKDDRVGERGYYPWGEWRYFLSLHTAFPVMD